MAINGLIPILIDIIRNTTKSLRMVSYQILIYMVYTSEITRVKMWEVGGPKIFLEYLDEIN
jgi:hypothetical protein